MRLRLALARVRLAISGAPAIPCLAAAPDETQRFSMRTFTCLRFSLAGIFLASFAAPALAHPHVWVTAQEAVVFDAQGQIAAIRHAWVFDDMYSAFATQGLAKDGQLATQEQLAPLAKTNVESL